MGDMSPFRRSHEPGRPDHRSGTPEAEGRQREARTLDGSGGLDAASVRRVWDQVLLHVKERKRVTHARLSDTQVAGLEGRRLTLTFMTATLARQFHEGVNVDVLRDAVQAVLGVDLDIVAVSGSPAPPVHAPGAPARPASGPPARHEGFAPGDEAADDDGSAQPAHRGEDAALRQAERRLGQDDRQGQHPDHRRHGVQRVFIVAWAHGSSSFVGRGSRQ